MPIWLITGAKISIIAIIAIAAILVLRLAYKSKIDRYTALWALTLFVLVAAVGSCTLDLADTSHLQP